VHLAAFPRITKIYVRGESAPGEYCASMNNCLWNFHKIHFLNYVSVAASITMARSLHNNLQLYEATPRKGRTLFWVPTPLRYSHLYTEGEVRGGEFSTY